MFLLGAIQCWRAIMPADFYLPGAEPENWVDDVTNARKLKVCLGERADHIQTDINQNRELIQGNAKKFSVGAIFGIIAPFVGVGVWAIALYFLH